MRKIVYIALMGLVMCLSSCIEEYNELPSYVSEPLLVVEGQIEEGECIFVLRQSGTLDKISTCMVPVIGAELSVISDNGSSWVAEEVEGRSGYYKVMVGALSSSSTYSLRISHDDFGVYQSEALHPLDAPAIDSLGFVGGFDNEKVSITLGTGDLHGLTYLMWRYDECWEIYTPLYARYYYDEASMTFQPETLDTHHGWATRTKNLYVISSNKDYGGKEIPKIRLYSRDRDDVCFQTRYYTKVRQMAISQQEYEYRALLEKQSLEMDGLFTPMPSELPGNIIGPDGKKAIGFIGVRGKIASKELYINRRDVGCARTERVHTEVVKGTDDLPRLLVSGMRAYDYNSDLNESSWAVPWTVDCRTSYWGNCSLVKPDFWIYSKD